MTRRVLLQLSLALGAIVGIAPLASASTITTITIYPDTIPTPNVIGDPTTSAPGFDSQSWQAGGGAKAELYIPVLALFPNMPTLTLGDIASISYWTDKPTTAADPDWTFYIYTAKTGTDDTGSFFHTRLNSEPYFTQTAGVPSDTWHEWSTDDPSNPMLFYDQARSDTFGTYNDPTLADLQAGAWTWGNLTQYDYRQDVISLFSLQTGSAWSNGFTGLVDGLTITLNNGDIGRVNLEAAPVPEPASLVLLGTGLIGVGARWRKRRAR